LVSEAKAIDADALFLEQWAREKIAGCTKELKSLQT
jgi:hypothetical protein